MNSEFSANAENLKPQNSFSGGQQENLSGMPGESFERESPLPTFSEGKYGDTISRDEIEERNLPELEHDLPDFKEDDSGKVADGKIEHQEHDRGELEPFSHENDIPPEIRKERDFSDSNEQRSEARPEDADKVKSANETPEANADKAEGAGNEAAEANADVNETKPTGGTYGELKDAWRGELEKEPPHEVHHMPANDINGLNVNDGPAIVMDKADHRQTASCGNSLEAREYRAKQEALIKEGKFEEAMQMDIDDIHEKFGNKYDDAIAQMKEKAKEKGLI